MGVYLHLFHGRNSIEEDMNDWGFDGPTIGPLEYVHVTYMSDLKIAAKFSVMEQFFPALAAEHKTFNQKHNQPWDHHPVDHQLFSVEGLIEHDGKFYGDWSVSTGKSE